MGARVVSFTCPVLTSRITVGTRVLIRAYYMDADDHGEPLRLATNVRATVTATAPGHRFACTIDEGQGIEDRYRFRRFQAHTRILEILEEQWSVCELGNVQTPAGKCDTRDSCLCRGFAGMVAAPALALPAAP